MSKKNIQVSRDHYFKNLASLSSFSSYLSQINSIIKTNPSSILEIGVGNRLVSNYLKEANFSVSTCDFDNSLKPDVVSDIRKLPFKKGEFDTVVAFEVLEHIPYSDVSVALKQLKKSAKKFVIISVPYSCASFSLGFRFYVIPFVNWFPSLSIRIPYFFKRIVFGGKNTQHYWELGKRGYPKRKLRNLLKQYFEIVDEFHPKFNSYHYFFVLKIN